MKNKLLIIALLYIWTPSFSQSTFKITGHHVKVSGSSSVVLKNTDLINEGHLDAPSATFLFTGSASSSLVSGGALIYNLKINKTGNQSLYLKDDCYISNQLEFVSDHNFLEVDSADLFIGSSASIIGYANNRFVVTDSSGQLVKKAMSTFTFPVGFDATSYNPLTLTENGIVDSIGVRCLNNVLENGLTGIPVSEGAVNASWEIQQDNAGGSNLDLTVQWNVADELSSFDRSDCGIMRYHSGDWDLPVTKMSGATGNDPYIFADSINNLGIIAIGGEDFINRVQLAGRVFLQGPYSGVQMTDKLRINNLIPLTEPFTGLGYAHQGRGGGESIESSVLDVTGEDAITDWVIIELRDKNDASVVMESFSALLQRDGDIVGLDGFSDVGIPVLDDDYFVAIRHRNHLGVRTPVVLNLAESISTAYDFTTDMSQAYGIDPMAEVSTGVWGMWGGNATGDNKVRATGPPTINDYSNILNYLGGATNIISNVYDRQDINMDGNVRATGPPTINDYAKLLNILGGAINIITEQL